ncbi:MAG: lipopolysaccharide export system permease protein [Hyphomicrobiales bacterium]|jgi:lipopolysaccharide export system permease protein|nr:lipopolysaccharide export system permease protein [Hyphomicrobiales bacterium]
MSAFDRYIFRNVFGAFLLILISLTAVIWLTHALREIDLMTNQRQTILTFIGITGLLIPMLVLVIAPLALVVAVGHTLNRLNTDSEIVVMNASGMSPWRIFRPFLTTTLVVALLVLAVSAYVAPAGLRELRDWATKVKADFVVNIVQPGRFINIERGLTLHIRERRADGQLLGIFIDDRRDPNERATSLAEYGEIVETGRGTFLVLINGSVQRVESGRADPTIVKFERYAFDLSRFAGGPQLGALGVRERNLWDVAFPDPNDPTYKQIPTHFRAELHDRIAAPIYPIAFTVLCFAILGAPRTSRQSREVSIVLTIVAIGALRLVGFACNVVAAQNVAAVYVLWGSMLLTFALGLYAIARGAVIEPPEFLTQLAAVFERMSQRLQPT